MRESARRPRILQLLQELWTNDCDSSLGPLLQKWIWEDYKRDIFRIEDTKTEVLLLEAIQKQDAKPGSELSLKKKEMLFMIERIWNSVPDQRLGQLLSNYGFGHFLSHPPNMMLQQDDDVIYENLKSSMSANEEADKK